MAAEVLGIQIVDKNYYLRLSMMDSSHEAAVKMLDKHFDPASVIPWLRAEYRAAHEIYPLPKTSKGK